MTPASVGLSSVSHSVQVRCFSSWEWDGYPQDYLQGLTLQNSLKKYLLQHCVLRGPIRDESFPGPKGVSPKLNSRLFILFSCIYFIWLIIYLFILFSCIIHLAQGSAQFPAAIRFGTLEMTAGKRFHSLTFSFTISFTTVKERPELKGTWYT